MNKKINVKDQIFNEMKLPELLAQAISKNFDVTYKDALKYTQKTFESKIDEVNKSMTKVGNEGVEGPETPISIDDFVKGKKILKG